MKATVWDKLDGRDNILRAFLYLWAIKRAYNKADFNLRKHVIVDSRLSDWFGHRKSSIYRWSDSKSANPEENTFFKRPTYWLYCNILQHFGCNPFKGCNTDQYKGYILFLSMRNFKCLAKRVLYPFIPRLGFVPTFQEHIIPKLGSYVLLFRMFWWMYPIYLISRLFFWISVKHEMSVPIEKSTTRKITKLPMMKELGMKLPDKDYIRRVYETYFGQNDIIGEACIKALGGKSGRDKVV